MIIRICRAMANHLLEYLVCAGLALFSLATACAVQPGAHSQIKTLEPSPTLTITQSPTGTSTVTAVPSPTVTSSPTLLPTFTSVATQAFQRCSPLNLHPLEELPQIIGDPYHPPPMGKDDRHQGVDFSYWHYGERDTMLGEPVQVVLAGVVAAALLDTFPYGNLVMIETPAATLPPELATQLDMTASESLYTLYAHLDQLAPFGLGETVSACQTLGEVGMSGNTDIPHLHLEMRLGPPGAVFHGMQFYDTRATQEEMDNYRLWRMSGIFRHFDPMAILAFPLEAMEVIP